MRARPRWGAVFMAGVGLVACASPAPTEPRATRVVQGGGAPKASPGLGQETPPPGGGASGPPASGGPSAAPSALGSLAPSLAPSGSPSLNPSPVASPAATASASPSLAPSPSPSPLPSVWVDTVAGVGTGEGTDLGSFAEGAATGVGALSLPTDVAVDPSSTGGVTRLFIADSGNRRVRLLTLSAGSAVLSTYAGNGELLVANDAPTAIDAAVGTQARFYNPQALAVAADGTLYVLDSTFGRSLIRVVSPSGDHAVTTLVRGPLASDLGAGAVDGAQDLARFMNPTAIALDATGQRLFVADRQSDRVRAVALASGVVSTFAGRGTAGVANAYAAQTLHGSLVNVPQPSGPALQAYLDKPSAVAVGGGQLFTLESFNPRLRRISDLGGTPTIRNATGPSIDWDPVGETEASAAWTAGLVDGAAAQAKFSPFNGARLCWSSQGLFIADQDNQRIRLAKLNPDGTVATVATVAGSSNLASGNGLGGFAGAFADGPARDGAKFFDPAGLALAPDGALYVADARNHRIRRIRSNQGSF